MTTKITPAAKSAKPTAAAKTPNVKAPENEQQKDIFWADQLAAQIIERIHATKKREAVCKAGASPSGAKHIGNLFDVMKGYVVYKALIKKGAHAKFILTHDDRDPLRTMPARFPSLEGKLVDTTEYKEEFVKFVGHPYHTVPDPFGCCNSWAEHFSKVWEDGIIACGVGENEIEFVSNNSLYEKGKFDPYIEKVLKNIDKVRKVFAPFQKTVKADYVPVSAICQNCGKITAKVVGWDLEKKTLDYVCETKMLSAKYTITGCGHRGTVPWSQAKLSWRFEWPAQSGIFNVDFEAFGKDHWEGSWPSDVAIGTQIYGNVQRIPHVYEFLLVNGAKMSARVGNVYIAQDILDIIEPEVFAYFYTKRSKKQRNLELEKIYQLVDDFEHVERVYWNVDEEKNEHDKSNAVREYESSMAVLPKRVPLRVEYQFAAMISQLAPDTEHAIKMLRASGHIKQDQHVGPDEVSQVARRLSLAKKWVHTYAPEMAVKINDTVSDEVVRTLSAQQHKAIHDLAALLKNKLSQEQLYNEFYEICKRNDVPTRDFFQAVYRIIMNKTAGPRLSPFILALGQDRVRTILEQV